MLNLSQNFVTHNKIEGVKTIQTTKYKAQRHRTAQTYQTLTILPQPHTRRKSTTKMILIGRVQIAVQGMRMYLKKRSTLIQIHPKKYSAELGLLLGRLTFTLVVLFLCSLQHTALLTLQGCTLFLACSGKKTLKSSSYLTI